MKSNKTVVPGMEDVNTNLQNFDAQIPNLQDKTEALRQNVSTQAIGVNNQKPVVGFLYSISKGGAGEFWPLRIGSNSVGRSSECDVCLAEATVSEQHAVLVVRLMKNPEKIIASICDARSTCGTMINGESLGFDQRECFSGDIITIGEHYELYLILIDAKQLGLSVCREFMPIHPIGGTATTAQYSAPVYNNSSQVYDASVGAPQSSGTVGIDDSAENNPPVKSTGTIFM